MGGFRCGVPDYLRRGRLAPPAGALLRPAREVKQEQWIFPERTALDAGIPREPLLPMLKGHFWIQGERFNLVSASGPTRWPLREGDGVQASVVHDPRGPAGAVRKLSDAEVWQCEGRTLAAWEALRGEGHQPTVILIEGGKAAGGQTAHALVLMAGYLLSDREANGSIDPDKLLRWLRRWKRGLLPRGAIQDTNGVRVAMVDTNEMDAAQAKVVVMMASKFIRRLSLLARRGPMPASCGVAMGRESLGTGIRRGGGRLRGRPGLGGAS